MQSREGLHPVLKTPWGARSGDEEPHQWGCAVSVAHSSLEVVLGGAQVGLVSGVVSAEEAPCWPSTPV